MPEDVPENSQSIEESIIGILSSVKDVLRYILKRWYVPLIFCLLGAGNTYLKQNKEIALYKYNIKFVKGSDLNPNIGGLAGVPEIFSKRSNADKISVADVIYSDIILTEALLDTYKDGSNEKLIDLFVRVYFSERSKNVKYTNSAFNEFSQEQISLFKVVKGRLQSRILGFVSVVDGNVPSVIVSSVNEELSIGIAENIFIALNNFYASSSATITKRNIDRLTKQSDSLKNILRVTEGRLASIKDVGGLDIKPTNYLSQARLEQKAKLVQEQVVGVESLLVQEHLKADITEPVYKVLNKPIPPLRAKTPNIVRATITGGIIGIMAGIFLILIALGLTKFWAIYKKA